MHFASQVPNLTVGHLLTQTRQSLPPSRQKTRESTPCGPKWSSQDKNARRKENLSWFYWWLHNKICSHGRGFRENHKLAGLWSELEQAYRTYACVRPCHSPSSDKPFLNSTTQTHTKESQKKVKENGLIPPRAPNKWTPITKPRYQTRISSWGTQHKETFRASADLSHQCKLNKPLTARCKMPP